MKKHFDNLWQAWAFECGLEGLEPEAGEPWVVGYDDLMITGFLDRAGGLRLLSHLIPWPEGGNLEPAARLALEDNARPGPLWPIWTYLDEEAGSLALTAWAPAALLTETGFTAFLEDFAARARLLAGRLANAETGPDGPQASSFPFPEGGLRL